MDYGFWSVLPPLVAIGLAIRTKQVFIALLFGIWLGWVILSGGNPLTGSLATVQGLVEVFQDEGNTRTIMFSALVGALIAFIQRSGGVEGFIRYISRVVERLEKQKPGRSQVTVQLLAFGTGMLIFVESSISVLTVGALFRPLFDRMGISREKLAYLADSSSAPSCILIPFNAWGAYIMGLLAVQGFDAPFATLVRAFPYNFYPFLAVAVVLAVVLRNRDYGPMRRAEERVRLTGELLSPNAQPVVDTEVTSIDPKPGVPLRPLNMLLPLLVMIGMMPLMLAFTGWDQVTAGERLTFGGHTLAAIGQGSGSTSVLVAVLTALLGAAVLYRAQGLMRSGEMVSLALKGISGLMPLALLMLLAFAISNVCRALGTGVYIAEASRAWLSPGLVPAIVFMVSCLIAFSTGTSWGTFAIMIPIAVPVAQVLGTDPHVAIAAALGGGIFGDHCSPISDTTILSSMASATDHIDHVKTQLPYALVAGGLTVGGYLVLGFFG
ncbi:Na+/H+ antiporter NhaC family protein [soil metagenome]